MIFLKIVCSGINMNLLTYRKPTHVYRADSQSFGPLGHYSVKGETWRWYIPEELRFRASINMLDHIAVVIGPWIDMFVWNMPQLLCILSLTDSTSAVGWLRKSNFQYSDKESQVIARLHGRQLPLKWLLLRLPKIMKSIGKNGNNILPSAESTFSLTNVPPRWKTSSCAPLLHGSGLELLTEAAKLEFQESLMCYELLPRPSNNWLDNPVQSTGLKTHTHHNGETSNWRILTSGPPSIPQLVVPITVSNSIKLGLQLGTQIRQSKGRSSMVSHPHCFLPSTARSGQVHPTSLCDKKWKKGESNNMHSPIHYKKCWIFQTGQSYAKNINPSNPPSMQCSNAKDYKQTNKQTNKQKNGGHHPSWSHWTTQGQMSSQSFGIGCTICYYRIRYTRIPHFVHMSMPPM